MALPIPDEDTHTRIVSEPVEFADLYDAFLSGCAELVREGYNGAPWWRALAIEDDGSKRRLTPSEDGELLAQFRQAADGVRAKFARAKFTRYDDESA